MLIVYFIIHNIRVDITTSAQCLVSEAFDENTYDTVAEAGGHKWFVLLPHSTTKPRGVTGVTKAPFVEFSFTDNFDVTLSYVILFRSCSYLAGVTEAELRLHLPYIDVIFDQ